MIIKVEDEYLDFDGDIQVERQVMNVENLESVGNFSYSFTIQPTSKNKRILGLESIDKANKNIFIKKPCELQTNAGIAIHYGSVLVTNSIGIECSFISGNTNFFNLIEGNVNEVDMSDLDVVLSEAAIVNSWVATSGMVFPLIDKGELTRRKTPFLRFNDFHAFVYVKDIFNGILRKAGLKMDGDLSTDGIYNSLITTNNSDEFELKKFEENNVYIGKSTGQVISSAGFTKIIFNDDSTSQFFNSTLSSYDTTNGRWHTYLTSEVLMSVTLDFSDPTKLVEVHLRRSGSGSESFRDFLQGSSVQFMGKGPDIATRYRYSTLNTDYWEIWAKVSATTPGSLTVTSGTFDGSIYNTIRIFAQSYLPAIPSKDFIKDIFRIFNVLCSYDIFTKTIHTRCFQKITQQEEQDISQYIINYSSEPGADVVFEYAKSNYLLYDEDDSDELIKYNKKNVVPYGGGNLAIDNDFLEKEKEQFRLNFTAPFTALYPVFGLQLIKVKFLEFTDAVPPDYPAEFTAVTNSGGLANFGGGGIILKENYYRGTSKGTAQYLYDQIVVNGTTDTITETIVINNIRSSNQILAIHLPNVTLPKTISFNINSIAAYRITVSNSGSNIPSYSGDWQLDTDPSTNRTIASIAVFAKYPDGTGLDTIKQSLSFGSDTGGQGLIDAYYRTTRDILNDPSKAIAEFIMPEHVYRNIDFLRPIRIRTKDFSSLFYLNKDVGYIDSSKPFQMELIKIN